MQFVGSRATTAIHVRIRRFDPIEKIFQVYFLLCDEYELVETLKARIIILLKELKFTLKGMEEDWTTDDIRLNLEMRVSNLIIVSTFVQVLDKDATCHDQQVFNDTLLYLCFKKPGSRDEYDDLTEVAGEEFSYNNPYKKKEDEAPAV